MPLPHLDISPEVSKALQDNAPVVALESTVITHGLPYPENFDTARQVEQAVRQEGAAPATIAVINGHIKIGLSESELDQLAQAKDVRKLNEADIALAIAELSTGGTTVAGTMFCAAQAGIRIFATGGLGGVHRGAEDTFDISQDLLAFTRHKVAVVTAGAKAILDLPKTLEYLETAGVPVIGYGTDEFPAFWCRESGLTLNWRIDTAAQAAKMLATQDEMNITSGTIIANPVPAECALAPDKSEKLIANALARAEKQNISGKAVTPFLLKTIRELSEGLSLAPNIALLENNARLAAQIAGAYCN